jgi:hypothetical protein
MGHRYYSLRGLSPNKELEEETQYCQAIINTVYNNLIY